MKFEFEYVEKLIELVEKHNLTELSLDDGEKAISLKKECKCVQPLVSAVAPQVQQVEVNTEVKNENVAKVETQGRPIVSPMVGTFYKAPGVGEKPFVELGDSVAVGQVVCIVEAMKLMNEIESEVSGKVTKICVEDGQPVEYGQVLMYVE